MVSFPYGWMNKWSGWSNDLLIVMIQGLVKQVNAIINNSMRFKVSELPYNFLNISWSIIYEIVTEKLRYKKLLCQIGSENINTQIKWLQLKHFCTFLQWCIIWPHSHWWLNLCFIHKCQVKIAKSHHHHK